MHRRKSSKEDESTRNRVQSSPGHFQLEPAPLGKGHSRTRSISAFAPPSPSPLSESFPTAHSFPSSLTPEPPTSPIRRHSRIHSRNISVFFPRPGSLPHSTITEDGNGAEPTTTAPTTDIPSAGPSVNWRSNRRASSLNQQQQPPPSPLGVGFTFGGRRPRHESNPSAESRRSIPSPPPMIAPSLSSSSSTSNSSTVSSRRGHHHKHSLSHNFFSFLEPGKDLGLGGEGGGEGGEGDLTLLHTQPTPVPVSPWTTTGQMPKPFNDRMSPTSSPVDSTGTGSTSARPFLEERTTTRWDGASVVGIGEFLIGAWLWVVGQQVGSLACTGLGYWVVFDAFGLGIARVVPTWLTLQENMKRPYGNARMETVLMFAQAVYLMFSSVYVCKETVEHVLLSAGSGGGGGGEKHHHHYHASDDDGVTLGIDFPLFLLFITFFSLTSTAFLYQNHNKLVNITHTRIPSLSSLIRSLFTTQRRYHDPPPTTQTGLVLSNPYIASPLFFSLSILFVALSIPPSQHEATDLLLAALIAIVTFNLAYRACTVLGTVLLQTAPRRGLTGGKMESFLRTMKELQKHPQVLHLPPPHIWQLAASTSIVGGAGSFDVDVGGKNAMLIVTIELRVRKDLGDEEVLRLTKWAWEKSMLALGANVSWEEKGKGEGPEVTVGVVRG